MAGSEDGLRYGAGSKERPRTSRFGSNNPPVSGWTRSRPPIPDRNPHYGFRHALAVTWGTGPVRPARDSDPRLKPADRLEELRLPAVRMTNAGCPLLRRCAALSFGDLLRHGLFRTGVVRLTHVGGQSARPNVPTEETRAGSRSPAIIAV